MELSKEYKALVAQGMIVPLKTQDLAVANPNSATRPMKQLKSVTIEAEFSELKGGRAIQVGHGRGSNNKAAAANAMRDLLRQPKLKAQRFTTCKAVISFGTIQVEDSNV